MWAGDFTLEYIYAGNGAAIVAAADGARAAFGINTELIAEDLK